MIDAHALLSLTETVYVHMQIPLVQHFELWEYKWSNENCERLAHVFLLIKNFVDTAVTRFLFHDSTLCWKAIETLFQIYNTSVFLKLFLLLKTIQCNHIYVHDSSIMDCGYIREMCFFKSSSMYLHHKKMMWWQFIFVMSIFFTY